MPNLRLVPPFLLLVACGTTVVEPTVRIVPEDPDTTDVLQAEIDGADGATVVWRWSRDGTLVTDLGTSRVPAERTTRGETWAVTAELLVDGEPGPSATADVAIGNAPPAGTATITPARPAPASTLVATGSGTDPDGDPVTFTWRWEANGAPVAGATADTLPPSGFASGTVVTAIGTPNDGTDDGPEVRAEVTLGNTAPTITSVAIVPSPLTAAGDALAQVAATDAEGDALTFAYAWTVDGSPAGLSERLPAERLRRGQRVELSVTASDGSEASAPVAAVPVFVVNAPPVVGRVRLTPANATTDSTLTCSAEAVSDADGDDIVGTTFRWEVNGTAVIGGATGTTLEADAIDRGDVVTCFARAEDADGLGPETASNPLTIANAPPVVRSARITTASPRPGEPLTLTLDVDDADGDDVDLSYTWRVNGNVAGSGATLPAAAFEIGDQVACTIVPEDPYVTGTAVTTATVTIENGAPVVTQVVFEPARPDVTTDIVAVPIFEDPEGDFVTFTYAWRINGGPVSGVTGNRLPGTRYRKGQRVTVVVTPADENRTGPAFTSAEVVVANAPPSLASAVLSPPIPTRTSGASCVPQGWFDPDGDLAGFRTTWFVNGSSVATTSTLSGSLIGRGDLVACSVIPDDGTDLGESVESATVAVGNSPPTLAGVALDPTNPREIDTITATPSGLSDPDPGDADQLEVLFAWRVNDVEVPGVTGDTLTGAHFDRGDRISAIAAAFDGTETGPIVTSETIEARNLAPEVRAVTIGPSPAFTNSTLSVVVDAVDLDSADAGRLTFAYTWQVDGATVLSGAQATLPGTFFVRGQQVRVGVVASDGDLSSPRTWSEPVTIQNARPSTPTVRMRPRWSKPGGNPLVCEVVVPSVDADGDALSYAITWTRDGVPYTAGGGLLGPQRTTIAADTVPSADLAAGHTWTCSVTPSDGPTTGTSASATGRVVATELSNLVSGSGSSCGIEPNGTVRCWGHNESGQAVPPDGYVATRLAGSSTATCGLSPSGAARCWGLVGSPSGGTFREVGAGVLHACGVTSGGNLACWGVNNSGSTSPPSGTWRDLVVGGAHACALDADSDPRCWGLNDRGQTNAPAEKLLRLSTKGDFTCGVRLDGTLRCWGATPPGSVPTGTFVDVSVGVNHACALGTDDRPVCWGDSAQVSFEPPAGVTFATIAAGSTHTCGVTTEGVTRCWGSDLRGQLRPPTLDVQRIVGGTNVTCAILADDDLVCWGLFGTGAAAVPTAVGAVLDVTLGEAHGCALGLDGTISCWGDAGLGQTLSPAGDGWVQIAAGSNHTCAVDLDGNLACWGANARGQTSVPSTGGPWAQVAAGGGHTCARSVAGAVTCWGGDDRGQASPPAGTYVDLAAGLDHACAIRSDTTIACWGDDTASQSSPTILPGWRQLTLGQAHGCAVRTDDAVTCWGSPVYGISTVPTATGFTELRAGRVHTCGMRVDGREQCWGLYAF